MKRIISIILSVFLLILSTLPAAAYDNQNPEKMLSIINMDSYANEIVESYLTIEYQSNSKEDAFSISQGFSILGNNKYPSKMYFLFNNDICVGYLIVTYYNNNYISSYFPNKIPFITQAYIKNYPIEVKSINESILIVSQGVAFSVYGSDYGTSYYNNVLSNSATEIFLNNIEFTVSDFNSRAHDDVNVSLNVIRVQNLKINGAGVCWAASIAAMVNYKSNAPDIDAEDVFYAVKNAYCDDGEDPVGNYPHVWYGFTLYNYPCYTQQTGLNFAQVSTLINNDLPIYAGIYGNNLAHAVVICGYSESSIQGCKYKLVDPNVPGYVWGSTTALSTDFTYTTGSGVYNEWNRYYY